MIDRNGSLRRRHWNQATQKELFNLSRLLQILLVCLRLLMAMASDSCVNLKTKSSVPIIHYKQNRLKRSKEKSFSQKPKLELQL